MALADFPPHIQAELQRLADEDARRILNEDLENEDAEETEPPDEQGSE
jgi:hypothetical protein